jgi:hypothetical protein
MEGIRDGLRHGDLDQTRFKNFFKIKIQDLRLSNQKLKIKGDIKMKNIIVTTFILLAVSIFVTINPAFAGGRVKVYEMAESGIIIEFKMIPEEIAAEDAENAGLAALREANNNNPQKRVKVFEMGESGRNVSFPMTAEEIAAEDTENTRLAAIRKEKSEEQKKQVVTYELAESGISVEFPVETPDKAVAEAITEKKSSDDSLN